jgi:hypothetical protein
MNTLDKELVNITDDIYTLDNKLNELSYNEPEIFISIKNTLINKMYTTCNIVNRLSGYIDKNNIKTNNKLKNECDELYKLHYKLDEIPYTILTKHILARYCIILKEHVAKIRKIIYKKSELDNNNVNYESLKVKHDLVCNKLKESLDSFLKMLSLNNNLKDELTKYKLLCENMEEVKSESEENSKLIILNNDIDKLKSDHIRYIDKLETYHTYEIYKLKTDHIEYIKNMNNDIKKNIYNEEIDNMSYLYNTTLNEMKTDYNKEIDKKNDNIKLNNASYNSLVTSYYELRNEIIKNESTIKKLESDNSIEITKNNTNKIHYSNECSKLITKYNKLSNTNNENEIMINKLKKEHTKFISEQNTRHTKLLIEINHKHTNATNTLKKENKEHYFQEICKLKTKHTIEIDQLKYENETESLINADIIYVESNVYEEDDNFSLVEED